ncbi:MAG: hypothetical protein M1535_05625 [Candidatus Thermoplasmatota archaeon]|jgi:hypothetical protein|nr:hypothetical protein [Candidatus Thermoplasmatota archaeon]
MEGDLLTLYNKLLALFASFIVVTIAFLIVSSEQGRNVEITAFPNCSYAHNTVSGMHYNSSFLESYGSGGYLSIYSEYASKNKPLTYGSVFQQVIVEKGRSAGKSWTVLCNFTFNMTARGFSQENLHLTPGYYQVKFGTLFVYWNVSDFFNGTLPSLHSAFMEVSLPPPSLLVNMIEIEVLILSILMLLDYARFRKKGDFY